MNRRYRKLRLLGAGGMGEVYLALDRETHTRVAIKWLQKERVGDRNWTRRFFREARLASSLDHPHIVRVLESGWDDDRPYMISEFLAGGDLQGWMLSAGRRLEQGLHMLARVAEALAYAHEQGVVHRDIKPSNILLTTEGVPKVADFGIATLLWSGGESRITQTGDVMGSVDYMAPEQRESTHRVDGRADIFSLGVVLYEMVTRTRPIGAFLPPSRYLPGIPPALEEAILKALHPQKAMRFRSAGTLAAILDEGALALSGKKTPEHEGPGVALEPSGKTRLCPEKDADTDDALWERLLGQVRSGQVHLRLEGRRLMLESASRWSFERVVPLLAAGAVFERVTGVELLGLLGDARACALLLPLLSDGGCAKSAAEALGRLGCSEAEEPLFRLLLAGGGLAYQVVEPLGLLRSQRAVPELKRMLHDTQPWVRQVVVRALGRIGGEGVRSCLKKAAGDPDPEVRAEAGRWLAGGET